MNLFLVFGGTAEFTVPPGKRLVIEHISADSRLPVGEKPLLAINVLKDQTVFHKGLIAVPQGTFSVGGIGGGSFDAFATSEQVRIYCEPEATVRATGLRNGTQFGAASSDVFISGYLFDVGTSSAPQ